MSLALSSPVFVASAAFLTREADRIAEGNWRANAAALTETQPGAISLPDQSMPEVTWLFARDGALTAIDASGAWWGGCSVPAAAARAMLKSLGGSGTVACFLRPPSASAVRVALDRLRANQALVVLLPDSAAAWVLLHCEDFAADVRAHRLWLVIGADSQTQLAALLRDNEGLPTPTQFVRLTDGEEERAEAMIDPAQRVFGEITQHRAAAIRQLQQIAATVTSTRACVIAASHFRLWDDAGHALAQLAAELNWRHLDPDDPACASPSAMAQAAGGCGAIILPNTGRADLPNVIGPSTRWITWLTTPRIPAFNGAGPEDVLLLADPTWRDAAIAGGWPESRVHIATWPDTSSAPAIKGPLLICADILPLDPPKAVVEMSSHRLLWDAIADELLRDPFALGASIVDYLHGRMKRLNIDALDQRRFIDDLIGPAYARGLADLLRRNGLPLRLMGQGWESVEMLRPFAAGVVATRQEFDRAVASSSALIHAWPTTCGHPIDHAGRPVVYGSRGRDAFLRDARSAIAGKLPAPAPSATTLTPAFLAQLIAPTSHSSNPAQRWNGSSPGA